MVSVAAPLAEEAAAVFPGVAAPLAEAVLRADFNIQGSVKNEKKFKVFPVYAVAFGCCCWFVFFRGGGRHKTRRT